MYRSTSTYRAAARSNERVSGLIAVETGGRRSGLCRGAYFVVWERLGALGSSPRGFERLICGESLAGWMSVGQFTDRRPIEELSRRGWDVSDMLAKAAEMMPKKGE